MMPRFTVLITRDVTESTSVTVDAPSEEAAIDAALEKLNASTDAIWIVDDNSWDIGSPYVTDVAETDTVAVCQSCGNTLNDGSDICDQCGGDFRS